ncbi:MAG: dTMP kinase [Bacillota bacterium]|nr:dTMP kinase [Bacillota bacterium]
MARRSERGLFITLEGPDGGGKSTQAARLTARLQALGVPVVFTREPGGTPVGEALRKIILDPASDLVGEAEVLLYAASRAQNVERVIRPALAEGKVVLAERFVDSSLAYQGYALGRGVEAVRQVNAFATGGLVPDLTLLLDVTPEVGLARAGARSEGAGDRIEQRQLDYHRKVREYYLRLAEEEAGRIRVIPTDGRTPAEVERELLACLARRFPDRFGREWGEG